MIGVIADDFSGATDVAAGFRRHGLETLLFFDVPTAVEAPPADVIVVALKSRSIPAADAVALSLAALDWLRSHGAGQIYFKYCSTFDSTPQGNIGPVLDALARELSARVVLTTPSSPEHLRTQYLGHLFVGNALLAESHMRHHPINPMTDSSLPRLLGEQTNEPVALVSLATVRSGPDAILAAVRDAAKAGHRYLLTDATEEADLMAIAFAAQGDPLVAGAAGLAGSLAATVASQRSAHDSSGRSAELDALTAGPAAVLSGSCSARTLEQIDVLRQHGHPSHYLDILANQDPIALAEGALAWYDELPGAGKAPLVFSSVDPAQLERVQGVLGAKASAGILEHAMGLVAQGLVDRGVVRIIVAGGETSGAVVSALGVTGGVVGAEAARGVPWIYTTTETRIALLLKSGNFGEPDLLSRVAGPTDTN